MLQAEINNLEKALKMLQSPIRTIPFLPLTHYKTIQTNREKNKTYWNNIAYQFLQQKHNVDTSHQDIPIKIYTRGLPHKLFLQLTLYKECSLWGLPKRWWQHMQLGT